jgi:hypothetical protein
MRSGAAVCIVLAGMALCAAARADDGACIAAAEAAIPLRKQGKLHDALKQLAVCAAAACPGEVKAECAQRIEAIRGAMPTLILAAKDGAGNDLTAAQVTLDGAPLPGALDGRVIDLDPGEHTLRFELAGQPPVEKKIVLRQGEKDRRATVVLGPPPATGAPGTPPSAPSSWSTQKTLAVASAGVGVVGVALGAVFGAYAISSQSREKMDCSASSCPNHAQGVEDYDTAQKNATGATVGLVVGGALVATGVVLWLTVPEPSAPDGAPRAVRVAPLVVGAGYEGGRAHAPGGGLVLRFDL